MNNILLIEEAAFIKVRLERVIESIGFRPIDIKNEYVSVTSFIEHFDGNVDVIIIDLDNHAEDPKRLIRNLGERKETKHIPIVALSSSTDVKVLQEIVIMGCTNFLLKPFSNDIFVDKLNKVLIVNRKADPSLPDEAEVPIGNLALSWDQNYYIGVESIDQEHKNIVEKFEKLYTLMKKGKGHEYYDELVEFLNDYIEVHFKNEEALQEKINYPDRVKHMKLHEDFKSQIKAMIDSNNESKVSDLELLKMNIFIRKWLVNHILVVDKKLATHIKK